MEYSIAIEYVRGAENTIADALSRLDSVAIDKEVPAELREESRHSLAQCRNSIAWTREPIGYLSNNPKVQSRMLSVS